MSALRSIAAPFVAAAPKGVRVRTRLWASKADVAVLCAVGSHLGSLITVGLDLGGLPASARDGHLRSAISTLIDVAASSGCRAIVIENLNFETARAEGRERSGYRPARAGAAAPGGVPWRASPPVVSGTVWSR